MKSIIFYAIAFAIAVTCRTPALAEPVDVSAFGIQRIKLGMTSAEVKQIKPEIQISNQNDPIIKFTACTGAGCGKVNDWGLKIEGTSAPYGSGVFNIRFQQSVGNVDLPTFIETLKTSMVQKYGKPSFRDPTQSYLACWGKDQDCKNLHDKNLYAMDTFYSLCDKCLIVKLEAVLGEYQLMAILFDPTPYTIAKDKQKQIEQSKKTIKF